MKKIVLYLFTVAALAACTGSTGPMGPPGPQGPSGDGGDAIVGQTFEFEDVDFDYEPGPNLWSTIIDIPGEIEVFDSDAILVYRLEIDGNVETFSLIPQNFFLAEGTIQYVYNHTSMDIEIMIDGDFDLSSLSTAFTNDQVFRFVVIPSDFANDPTVNIDTFSDLLDSGIEIKQF